MPPSLVLPAMPIRPRLCGPDAPASVALVDGHLRIGLTVDDGTGERPVTQADLQDWNTTADQLLPMAIERLRLESHPSGWIPVETVPGMALYQALDGQSSARALLLARTFQDWPLAGIAIAVPSPDQLLVVPLHEVEDLDALHVLVTAARLAWESADQPLSDQAFWYDGRAWHHIDVVHDRDEAVVTLPAPASAAIGRLAAMGLVARAGEA